MATGIRKDKLMRKLLCIILVVLSLGWVSAEAQISLDVTDFGANGSDQFDDTEAIQATINWVDSQPPQPVTINFPAGTYIVRDLQVVNKMNMTFQGVGITSVVQRSPVASDQRIMTVDGSTNITFRNIAFDASGIERYGGVVFYNATTILIDNTDFYDSNQFPIPPDDQFDRYSYVFGRGANPSTGITIRNNRIQKLQLELDHVRNVTVQNNHVQDACCTAGIGFFTINNGTVAEDVIITGNTISNPIESGIALLLDPPETINAAFRRVQITDNTITGTTQASVGIFLGTAFFGPPTTGNVYEDFVIARNTIDYSGSPLVFSSETAMLSLLARDFFFERFTMYDNALIHNRTGGWAMDLRRLRNSAVYTNTIRDAVYGLSATDRIFNNQIYGNVVHAAIQIAYGLGPSDGQNTFQNNYYSGSPTMPLFTDNLQPSDIVQPPILITP